MWFKQAQLFELTNATSYLSMDLHEKLMELAFRECLPSMPASAGWVSPVDEEDAPLVQTINGYIMLCLQVEEKILPAAVVNHEVAKKVKQIEEMEDRKMGQKEKYSLKDAVTVALLTRAFTKLTRIYAYIDTKNHWLILGTANTKKTDQFLSIFRKIFGENIHTIKTKKPSTIMTAWLKYENYASSFSIEKSCVLQDPNFTNRVIRCKEQDLFANSIQLFIKEGCEIKQLALHWQDRITFNLLDNLILQSIKFNDTILDQIKDMEAGTKQQQFNADFLIMTETFDGLWKDLLNAFGEVSSKEENVVTLKKIG